MIAGRSERSPMRAHSRRAQVRTRQRTDGEAERHRDVDVVECGRGPPPRREPSSAAKTISEPISVGSPSAGSAISSSGSVIEPEPIDVSATIKPTAKADRDGRLGLGVAGDETAFSRRTASPAAPPPTRTGSRSPIACRSKCSSCAASRCARGDRERRPGPATAPGQAAQLPSSRTTRRSTRPLPDVRVRRQRLHRDAVDADPCRPRPTP